MGYFSCGTEVVRLSLSLPRQQAAPAPSEQHGASPSTIKQCGRSPADIATRPDGRRVVVIDDGEPVVVTVTLLNWAVAGTLASGAKRHTVSPPQIQRRPCKRASFCSCRACSAGLVGQTQLANGQQSAGEIQQRSSSRRSPLPGKQHGPLPGKQHGPLPGKQHGPLPGKQHARRKHNGE